MSYPVQKSHHYAAENIAAIVEDLRAIEEGREVVPAWKDRDHRTHAGILWRVILALSHDVPIQAQPQEPVVWVQPDHLQKARLAPFLCRVEPTQRCADFVPLYTAPPAQPQEPVAQTWRRTMRDKYRIAAMQEQKPSADSEDTETLEVQARLKRKWKP